MAKLTLGQAAKHAQRSKGTISKALNNGALTGEKIIKNGRETWQIDPSELQRWMDVNPLRDPTGSHDTTPMLNTGNDSETNALQIEVATLREQLKSAETDKGHLLQRIEDLKDRAERAESKEDTLQRMLEDQRGQTERKGFWARLRG